MIPQQVKRLALFLGQALNLGYSAGSANAKVTGNYFAGGAIDVPWKLVHLLRRYAERLGMSVRNVYRDLHALDEGAPGWWDQRVDAIFGDHLTPTVLLARDERGRDQAAAGDRDDPLVGAALGGSEGREAVRPVASTPATRATRRFPPDAGDRRAARGDSRRLGRAGIPWINRRGPAECPVEEPA